MSIFTATLIKGLGRIAMGTTEALGNRAATASPARRSSSRNSTDGCTPCAAAARVNAAKAHVRAMRKGR